MPRPLLPGLRAAVPRLRCPVCRGSLRDEAGTLRCANRHAFDVARQGYVHLAPGLGPGHGDTAAMVAARDRFLTAGHFAPVVEATAGAVTAPEAGCVVDVGAGTGHYLAAFLRHNPGWDGIAVDSSKPALRRAARAHPRIATVAADAWGDLPLADGAATAVLSVFAPRGPGEFVRVLRPGGRLVVVTPTVEHLHELVAALGLVTVDPQKDEHLAGKLAPGFAGEGRRSLRWTMALDHPAIADLVGMGPSAWHIPAPLLTERIATLPAPFAVTASVRVGTYRRRDSAPDSPV